MAPETVIVPLLVSLVGWLGSKYLDGTSKHVQSLDTRVAALEVARAENAVHQGHLTHELTALRREMHDLRAVIQKLTLALANRIEGIQ